MAQNIRLQIGTATPAAEDCDALVVFVSQGEFTTSTFKDIDRRLGGSLSKVLKQEKFQGKLGDQILYHASNGIRAPRVIIAGLGKKEDFSEETLRRASAGAAVAARDSASTRVSYTLPVGKVREDLACRAIAEGAILGSYRFTKFKTREDEAERIKRDSNNQRISFKESSKSKSIRFSEVDGRCNLFCTRPGE